MRKLIVGLLNMFAISLACAQAAPPQALEQVASAPAGFVAPALPKMDESNAQRAKSQPGNNAPFWRAVHGSGDQAGISNLPGAEKGVLIQSMVQYPGSKLTTAGEAWRQVRNQWIIPYGGSLLLITVLALALFYFSKGTMGGHVPYTGRLIERFTYFERAAHWSNAAAFSLLAVSGLVMAFGKFFLLPVLGGTLFGWLAYALKTAHNFAGPLFAVSLFVVFVTFVRDNLPTANDLKWLLKGGGLFGEHEVPSARFNAGEKVVFWAGVFVLGFTVVASGLVLDQLIPGLAYLRGDMQIAHMIHASASVLMMTLFLGHIYMGTMGMKDALSAMKTGMVDEGWAKEHHELWFDDIRAGKIPAQRSTGAAPAGAVAAQH
ncbi:formate dehydrogenase subunit gamma [Roseateles oligotrophus]|uniref:Formate dehydrogenase subunit gamma n=1 Tax=Roseateles oligotrophus TaxID=1769250 RepID=A0ABT2Y981_9BURK|nr:formate dehydrogenase subunit gamma [Roseateles oligotrophus]MCV2366848.1 formate dehydrogenase subunit gamma [Roseateles oligotrophus]